VIFDVSNDGALSDSIVQRLNLNNHDDDEEEAEKQESPTIKQQPETHNGSSPRDKEEPTSEDDLPPSISQQEVNQKHFKYKSSHPMDNLLTDVSTGIRTRSSLRNFCAFLAFVLHIEPKII